jgi:ABC-type polysaccharide/polyol phosphate export permease
VFTYANPVTYRVDAIRGPMLGTYAFGTLVDLTVIPSFALAMIGLGTLSFKRMKL